MKTSGTWNISSVAGKMLIGLVLAAMISSVDVLPAFGRDDHKRQGRHDNRRYEERGREHDRDYRYVKGKRVYYYRERVYAPPPVVYAPPPPPGISIFFPPIFIHP
ncbi:MAG: hypothetical protein HPY65_05040 [Syntrophaceae bacterium]|nr:hypothetical protein [Syntrophaceae bacterium]